MTYRKRRYYSEKDKGLIWERWKSGVSQHDIARLFSTKHSSIDKLKQILIKLLFAGFINKFLRLIPCMPSFW